MFLKGAFQRQVGCSTWQSKLEANIILKMPLSLSPFLQPFECSPHLDDNLDYNAPEELSRLTNNNSLFSSNKQPSLCASTFTKPPKTSHATKQHLQGSFISRRKTLLRIIRLILQKEATGRTYLVECRYGNQAAKHTTKITESRILQKDPQLLIQFLTAKGKVKSL